MNAVHKGSGNELLRRTGDALRVPSPTVPIALERLATAMDATAAVSVRRAGVSVFVDGACVEDGRWRHETTLLRELDAPSFEALDPEAVVTTAAAAVALADRSWAAGRAAGEAFVLGISRSAFALDGATMDAIAMAFGLIAARDLATTSARMNALLLERARIASEIHQGVSQEMATLVLQLQVLSELLQRDPKGARELLTEIERSADLCSQNLRASIFHLTPVAPDKSWLAGGLQQFVAEFAQTWRMTIAFEVLGSVKVVPADSLVLVFAFVQEGLTNIRKHSSSGRGTVRIKFGERTLRAEVIDDVASARGAAHAVVSPPLGHGLSLLRARARLVGGNVEFARLGERGTRLMLEIPI